ncbi:MAG: DUF881 domain-containing protein [Bacillota bacterium]|nr:DUF881 domain-containing protein [Bacillota bacterium]
MSKHRKKQGGAIAIFFITMTVLGFLAVVTIRSHVPADIEPQTEKDSIISMIHQIESENEKISLSIEEIKQEIEDSNYGDFSGKEMLAALEDTVTVRKSSAGFEDTEGAGLSIILNDNPESAAKAMEENPGEYNAANYIVHDKNLLYLINDLRPYADAIAINDHRIISTSSIRCVGTVIMVDQVRLAPPYRIEMTGEPSVLMEQLKKSSEYHIIMDSELLLTVTQEDYLDLPAYTGTVARKYSTVVEDTAEANEAEEEQ